MLWEYCASQHRYQGFELQVTSHSFVRHGKNKCCLISFFEAHLLRVCLLVSGWIDGFANIVFMGLNCPLTETLLTNIFPPSTTKKQLTNSFDTPPLMWWAPKAIPYKGEAVKCTFRNSSSDTDIRRHCSFSSTAISLIFSVRSVPRIGQPPPDKYENRQHSAQVADWRESATMCLRVEHSQNCFLISYTLTPFLSLLHPT